MHTTISRLQYCRSTIVRYASCAREQYDYIIVGAGSAGCLLAKRLTEDPSRRVLLIEAGGSDAYPWIQIPIGYLYCINNPKTDWMYKTENIPYLYNRSLIYPRGKVLGGCSSINGMIYMRGQQQDYDSWAETTGDQSWSWKNCLERFKKFENYYGGENEWHGSGGEWNVEQQRLQWDVLEVFKAASMEAGIPYTSDFNRGSNHGVGYFDVNQVKGFRLSSSRAFLKDAKHRKNLDIITSAHVDYLNIDKCSSKCTGLVYIKGSSRITVSCEKEVILSSGAIGSVQVLERSGVGAEKRLRAIGIDVKCPLEGVGENFQDHLQLRLVYKVKGITSLNTQVRSILGLAEIGAEYILNRSGPLSMAPSQLGAFAHSSLDQNRPDLQYHVQPLSLDRFGSPLHDFNAFTASVCNLRPTSRGYVHITSADPLASPAIQPQYLTTQQDRRVAADAIRLTRHIVSSSSFTPYEPEEYSPGTEFNSDDELVSAAGRIGTTIFHPVGTCRMGRVGDPMAVTDGQLRVRGVEGIRVCDAAVMPTITSGNTAAPTMMIAQRLAELLCD